MYGQCFEYISMKAKRICNKKYIYFIYKFKCNMFSSINLRPNNYHGTFPIILLRFLKYFLISAIYRNHENYRNHLKQTTISTYMKENQGRTT